MMVMIIVKKIMMMNKKMTLVLMKMRGQGESDKA
jgi:hypothetical protein